MFLLCLTLLPLWSLDLTSARCSSPGSVRFYNSPPANITQGLVEVCHQDTWHRVCLPDASYASTTCRQLGFLSEGIGSHPLLEEEDVFMKGGGGGGACMQFPC